MNDFVANSRIVTPDLSAIPDGKYTGRFRSGVVSARVRVIMASGRIESVKILRHFNGRGEAAEIIVDSIVRQQKLELDAVSGATYSSKVILKAAEVALSGKR